MNSMQIKDKIRNVSNKKNLDFNIILRLYMYDRFIERLSISKYKEKFILKGGFYLSALFGIENRSTMDIDTALTNVSFSEENIIKIIKEIISIDIEDGVKINFNGISSINKSNDYAGYRVTITIILENIKETFHIDIILGDLISSEIIKYNYFSILNNKTIELLACNLESVLSEKIETILSRVEANSRMRDFYDIYLIYKTSLNSIDKNNFRKIAKTTFKKRNYYGDLNITLFQLKHSQILRKRWNVYANKNDYAKNISYEDVIDCLEILIKTIMN